MNVPSNSNDPLSTRVTRIQNRWHCRLIKYDSQVVDEMACAQQRDIGWCLSEMLRWYDKTGNSPYSAMAAASRDRGAKKERRASPNGKVWYRKSLPIMGKMN